MCKRSRSYERCVDENSYYFSFFFLLYKINSVFFLFSTQNINIITRVFKLFLSKSIEITLNHNAKHKEKYKYIIRISFHFSRLFFPQCQSEQYFNFSTKFNEKYNLLFYDLTKLTNRRR